LPSHTFGVRRLFTVWCSHKWSVALAAFMFFVSIGDVVSTFLNAEKYGIETEANPIARSMIQAGQPFASLWVLLSITSTLLLYIPLVSFYLMSQEETREGRGSTIISGVLAARISVVVYDAVVFHYPTIESLMAVSVVGVMLMFSIRFIMRHGDSITLGSIKSALSNLGGYLRSSSTSWLSKIVLNPLLGIIGALRKRPGSPRGNTYSTQPEGAARPVVVRKRRYGRILILTVGILLIPVLLSFLIQILTVALGVTELPWYLRTLVTIGGEATGTLFLIVFILTIVSVAVMIWLVLTLFDELSGSEQVPS
jgi:hypothetical protein